jgi:transcriptional antiterminator RfaH
MGYWACAQTAPHRESVARHFLQLAEFEVYFPQIRERRLAKTGKVEVVRPLFPNYLFIRIELQWCAAGKAVGVARLILDGERPAIVSDQIVEDLRRRERNGFVHLPRQSKYRRGDKLRIVAGPFCGRLVLCEGMTPRERVLVLLRMFGTERKIEVSQNAVESR